MLTKLVTIKTLKFARSWRPRWFIDKSWIWCESYSSVGIFL